MGTVIDTKALKHSTPGSVTYVDDPNSIRSESPQDVTSSSYLEQDRLNMDIDELAGSFSSSSVASNRALNETVGGMEMLSGSADDVTEYQLRTYAITFIVPLLQQLVRIEQWNENDEALLEMVGKKARLWQRFDYKGGITDSMMQHNMTIDIDVGFGSTNPEQRMTRIVNAVQAVSNMVPGMAQRMDPDAVAKALMTSLGFESHLHFFPEVDPENPPQPPEDPAITVAKLNNEVALAKLELDKMEIEMKYASSREQMEQRALDNKESREVKMAQAQISAEKALQESNTKAGMSEQQQKARLAETAMRERNQNERFARERRDNLFMKPENLRST